MTIKQNFFSASSRVVLLFFQFRRTQGKKSEGVYRDLRLIKISEMRCLEELKLFIAAAG